MLALHQSSDEWLAAMAVSQVAWDLMADMRKDLANRVGYAVAKAMG